ncbi:MAG: DUF3604 domain-containing protein [Myxococcales bacterium]|nr:DUF3604 domain-containing protein [Myxococcales bacterium]
MSNKTRLGITGTRACRIAAFAAALSWVAGPAAAQDCPDYNPERNPYFGDTHVHTAFSFDAVLLGVEAEPSEAYEFAKGAAMALAPSGRDLTGSATVAQLERPLDFTAVTDHAEFFGEFHICTVPPADPEDPAAPYNNEFCEDYRATAFGNRNVLTTPGPIISQRTFGNFARPLRANIPERHPFCLDSPDCAASSNLIWQESQDAAQLANDPCAFTALNAYEWTRVRPDPAIDIGGTILHRNVIFRGDAVPANPISVFEAPRIELLWDRLQQECRDAGTGCDVLTIPHNSNQSAGRAFAPVFSAEPLPDEPFYGDRPLTAADAEVRASFEPVVEIMQGKGASECRIFMLSDDGVPFLGTDELCDFESDDAKTNNSAPVLNNSLPRLSFVREGLKEGLVQEEALGVNPFQLGILASTDTHNATPGQTSEEEYAVTGHHGITDGVLFRTMGVSSAANQNSAGGLAVAWAPENTRDAIFDAIQRKEVYGTSGRRPIVRFFAGSFPRGLCRSSKLAATGYRRGVPMGGELGDVRRGGSPSFAVMAEQDAGGSGTPLQRIQIVKGWVDENGEAQEAVYDVAGDPDNGASVDVNTCEPQGTGFASLCTVWKDPDFDAGQRAFYYTRVIDNPTCRWNQQLCVDTLGHVGEACDAGIPPPGLFQADLSVCCDSTLAHRAWCVDELADLAEDGVACGDPEMPEDHEAACCAENYPEMPTTIQERAWSSPIFYRPESIGQLRAKISFGKSPQSDRLNVKANIARLPSSVDFASQPLSVEIRDDDVVYAATLPAGSLEPTNKGFDYRDRAGSIDGLTRVKIVRDRRGTHRLSLKSAQVDLSAADRVDHPVEVRLTIGDFDATHVRTWELRGRKLQTR